VFSAYQTKATDNYRQIEAHKNYPIWQATCHQAGAEFFTLQIIQPNLNKQTRYMQSPVAQTITCEWKGMEQSRRQLCGCHSREKRTRQSPSEPQR